MSWCAVNEPHAFEATGNRPKPGTAQRFIQQSACLSLHLRHIRRDGVSNHQPYHCLLNHLFGRRSKKTWKLRVTGLCAGNSPVTGEFPAKRASNAEKVSICWRHHVTKSIIHPQTGACNRDARAPLDMLPCNLPGYIITLHNEVQ